jgi:hypothetical protein
MGRRLGGQSGFEIGETLGGLLGLPLGCVAVHYFFYAPERGSRTALPGAAVRGEPRELDEDTI